MKNRFRIKGFTLVELLIVITILGILAAIAVPRLFPQTEKARVAEAINILSAIRQGEEAYLLTNGTYQSCGSGTGASVNTCYETLGMQNPNPGRYFNYEVSQVAGSPVGFDATATRNTTNNPSGQFNGSIILDETGTYTCPGTYAYCPKS